MKKLLLSFLFLVSCNHTEYQNSPEMTETAKVINSIYTPSIHSSTSSMGLTTGGDVTFTPISVNVPEQYGLVFKCQHGQFCVVGPEDDRKQMWETIFVNANVLIHYNEVYRVEFDGDKEISRTLVKYHFIRAEAK